MDRAKALRTDGEGGDENSKEERLKRLEEMYKLQQIDAETLEKLRRELGVGGKADTTHLVKGLDFELLKRVRAGEDVLNEPEKKDGEEEGKEDEAAAVDDELDGVLGTEVQAVGKNESLSIEQDEESKPEAEVLSRDEILRRLKASRAAAAMPPPPPEAALNDRFKKVGSDSKAEKKRFTEVVNGRRREVLLTTDKDGKSKRKVRWLDPPGTHVEQAVEPQAQEVLGMEVPAEIAAKQKALLEQQKVEEDDDDDIFAGVGADYDPLADIGSDEDASDKENGGQEAPPAAQGSREKLDKPHNYFGVTTEGEPDTSHSIANDPTILAALKRAAALRQAESGAADREATGEEEDLYPEKALKRKAFLERLKQQQRDDAQDLDMGFGESRFGDEEDEDGPLYNSGDEKKEKRKRAPKKRKGDKDNVKDVMGVLEGRNLKK